MLVIFPLMVLWILQTLNFVAIIEYYSITKLTRIFREVKKP